MNNEPDKLTPDRLLLLPEMADEMRSSAKTVRRRIEAGVIHKGQVKNTLTLWFDLAVMGMNLTP